ANVAARRRRSLEFGQAPQSAPDSLVRPPLQQHAAVIAANRDDHEYLSGRSRARRTRRRKFVLTTCVHREASLRQRTVHAQRLGSRAQRGAEVHDRLRVSIQLLLWSALIRQVPEPLRDCALCSISFHTEIARQHALHISIEDREALAATQRQDGASCGPADSRQTLDVRKTRGKLATEFVAYSDSRAVQI